MLPQLKGATPEDLLGNWRDGRIKLFLTQRLLVFRQDNPDLFRDGSYTPLELTGEFAENCIAFARKLKERSIILLAPRLSSRIGFPPLGDLWRDTAVQLPEGFSSGRDLLTGGVWSVTDARLRLAFALARFPVGVMCAPE